MNANASQKANHKVAAKSITIELVDSYFLESVVVLCSLDKPSITTAASLDTGREFTVDQNRSIRSIHMTHSGTKFEHFNFTFQETYTNSWM